jgi:3-dehydroquinate synthetase
MAAAGLPVSINLRPAQYARLLAAMRLDKKVSDGEIKFVLASRIGAVQWGQKVPEKFIRQALEIPL